MESGCSFQLNMMRMVVKMAAFPSIAVLLLCCSSVASTDSCDVYAETNKDVIVPLGIPPEEKGQLQWKLNEQIVFHRRPGKLIIGSDGDVTADGSLKLTKVSKDKAGTYTPGVFSADGKLVGGLKNIKLCVIDPVPQPKLKIDCKKKPVMFTCDVPKGTNDLTFAWVQDGKPLKDKKGSTLLLQEDKVLQMTTLSCNVSNKVSTLASETQTQICHKPGFVFPKEIFGISVWYYVGGGGGVVLLLIILVVICCIRMRRKKTMQVKDEEELRLGWTNPNQQHHHHQHGPAPSQHHHHHHHQQQPAGHTGPRQHRTKQPRGQQRPSRDPAHPNGQPQPSPRRAAQVPKPADTTDDEKPPPLPQPRKKAPKTARV
ncbi:T-cell surface antigen CD2 isoform X1 [Acanthopagrus latus]|uniref:T-cell surface antigen CD2 isoform X1 n=2 Tax=Acanthopagrus latus TaxID=8177 RepID=UPI00187CAE40|nr:T-cell surface antigen CD2 isoform X1 [Acanthopagrus latus]XP_036946790.1 T-cell surface antigen CD2 isoform X2 [Acanthopagrus latus]XP_036946791.1 T-cell surface antigen CD2 isoform X1 [Acanthopagrus latus]